MYINVQTNTFDCVCVYIIMINYSFGKKRLCMINELYENIYNR